MQKRVGDALKGRVVVGHAITNDLKVRLWAAAVGWEGPPVTSGAVFFGWLTLASATCEV